MDFSKITSEFIYYDESGKRYIHTMLRDTYSIRNSEFGCSPPKQSWEYDLLFKFLNYLRINNRI
jgi:hypothetical protein